MLFMNENPHPPIEICLALGSNLGNRQELLSAGREALAPYMEVTGISAVYETQPAYAFDQPLFLNTALRGTTRLDPKGLLYTLKDIELALGRQPTYRFGPRVIDIDIIFYGDTQMHLPDLTIPHLLMAERVFVLKPLADIAADWVHPESKKTVADLLAALPDVDTAIKISESF